MEGQKPPSAIIFSGHAGQGHEQGGMQNPYGQSAPPYPEDPNIPLKYKPELSFRTLSTTVGIIGLTIWVLSGALGNSLVTNGLCCGTLVLTALLDSVHNVGKRKWLKETGQSSFGETVNLILNLILVPAIVCVFLLVSLA